MERKLRLAMVGAGNRANLVIYPAFNALENVEFVGICDIDAERLKATGDKYNIQNRYGERGIYDYQRMIREQKPDAVAVIGDPDVMYPIWKWCLEQKLNLYVEKPLALNIHQARSLAELARRGNCVTQVSLQRRYTPMVRMLREKCLEHGSIVHSVCEFYKCEIQDRFDARDHMMDDCVHAIDTLRWIHGCEVVDIESTCRRIQTADINFISAVLHFEDGSIGHLINSWSSGKRTFRVEMHAPGVFVDAEHENKGYLYENGDVQGQVYDAREISGSDEFYVFTGVKAAAAEFADACLNGGQPACNFTNACKTMEVAEKILAKALLNGQ